MDWEKEFIKFLAEEGVLFQFHNNVKNGYLLPNLQDLLKTKKTTLWISLAFAWNNTKEGHVFWRALHKKWRGFCEKTKFNLKEV